MSFLSPLRAAPPLLGCALVAVTLAACGGSDDESSTAADGAAPATDAPPRDAERPAEAPTRVVGGQTELRLDGGLLRVLDTAGITVGPAGAARERGDAIVLPVTGGELDLGSNTGEIRHAGGIELSAAGRSVAATDLVVDAETGAVTARIDGRRVRLLSADLGPADLPQTDEVIVLPAEVTFAEEAVRTLNERIGVEALSGGLSVGDLTVNAKRP